jgi:glutaredoxin-like YruB-family protein
MPKVKVYSTPTCMFCKQAKAFLKENKVEYEDIDVSADQRAAEEMIEKTGQMGVPVIEVDNEVVIGFDKAKLEKLLGLKPAKKAA